MTSPISQCYMCFKTIVTLCTTKVKFVNCAIQMLYFNCCFSVYSISCGEKHINISPYGGGFLCSDHEKIISLCWFCLHWVKPKLCLHISKCSSQCSPSLILCSSQFEISMFPLCVPCSLDTVHILI